jgi:glycosyltransferase involved in cell wall biosynthesis
MASKQIAIVYDRVNKFGGAEQVLMALHNCFPDAPLYTSVFDPRGADWVKSWNVRTSFLQRIPFAKEHHEWFGWLMPLAFESLDLSGFDVVISVTSEAAKGILTSPNQLHICYCLTPTRYLWSHTFEYGSGALGWLKRLFFTSLREWDGIAATRPDRFIAISEHIARRIEKYYKRGVDGVIYPPAQIQHQKLQKRDKGDYFLTVSRLVPYKKVDRAIQACIRANKKLIIVGTGSDEARLRQIANNNPLVSFAGFVSDSKLSELYAGAIALICPQEEDFGIVSVEAQSHGVPVLSPAKSGMVETILDGETGVIYRHDLEEAMQRAEGISWDTDRIRKHAAIFAEEVFERHWKKLLGSYSVE